MTTRTDAGASSATAPAALPWVPLLILLAWEIAARVGRLPPRMLPEPLAVARSGWRLLSSGALVDDFVVSARRALLGIGLGGGLGMLLGFAAGAHRLAGIALGSTARMIHGVPVLATVPLAMLWFRSGEPVMVLLAALVAFVPIFVDTLRGVRSIDRGLIEMARSYGVTGPALYRHVILPGALPSILTGVRGAFGLTWATLIVAEMLFAQSGIGSMTTTACELRRADVVLVGILLYALLGKCADLAAHALERALLRWHPAPATGGWE